MANRRKIGQTYKNFGEVLSRVSEVLKPPERLTVSQAAEKYRYINNPGSYVGPWKNSTVQYLVEPMDALGNRAYNAVIFVGPAQCGKTDMILNWHLYNVTCDPSDFLLYQTSQTMARDFSRRRVDRLHRDSKAVGSRLMRRGDADNTFDKFYNNGTMLTLSWPTINELSGRPVGRVALTDYDRMPLNVDGEGSPFDLARKRTTTFGTFAKTLAESSPGYASTDLNWMPTTAHESPPAQGIASLYNRGDRRRWYWPCPHCGEFFEPSFKLLWYPNSKDPVEAGEAAAMTCPHCYHKDGALIMAESKSSLNEAGLWLPDGMRVDRDRNVTGRLNRADIASFWLKGPAATFASWKSIVVNHLKATEEYERTGNQDPLKTTVNVDQGEVYFEKGHGSERLPEELHDRSEDWNHDNDEPSVAPGIRFLIATIDVQANRWEVQVHGVSAPPVSNMPPDIVVIDRFPIIKSKRVDADGDRQWVKPATYIEDWELITEQVLRRTYPLADGSGRRMPIKMTACDSGGKKGTTSMAYEYYRGLRRSGLAGRFQLVKGEPNPKAPRINLTYPDSGRKDRFADARGEIPVLLIQTDKIKDQLNAMLDRLAPGGMIRFSRTLPKEFFGELVVETQDTQGRWINPQRKRNEAWDLLVYCLALMSHLRIEMMDWTSPPRWAEEWEHNSLIVQGESESAFESKSEAEYSLEQLGVLLG